MTSLKLRLGVGIVISVSIVFVVLWIAGSQSIRLLIQQQMTTRLHHDSETLLSRLTFDAGGHIQLDLSVLDPIYLRPFSGHYYIVETANERIRSRSLWDQDLAVASSSREPSQQLQVAGPQQQTLLALQHVYQKRGRDITITVAEDITTVEQQINRFRNWFGLVALLSLTLLVLFQVFIVRASMSPLTRTRQQITELESGQRSQLDSQVPTELKPHVDAINYLLTRMHQRLQHSRHAMADLAHALKKPLTVLTQLSEDECLEQCSGLREQLQKQTEDILRSTDHVLRKARLAGDGPALAPFSLQRDMPALLDTLSRMYPHKTLSTQFSYDDHDLLAFDREDMMELLGNLLDNACKWSQQHILFKLQVTDALLISIDDDGPGVDSSLQPELSRRGQRLDESRQGHGLGLAIVHDIVTQYRGSITFSASPQFRTGLHVDIRLPLKQDATEPTD